MFFIILTIIWLAWITSFVHFVLNQHEPKKPVTLKSGLIAYVKVPLTLAVRHISQVFKYVKSKFK